MYGILLLLCRKLILTQAELRLMVLISILIIFPFSSWIFFRRKNQLLSNNFTCPKFINEDMAKSLTMMVIGLALIVILTL